MNIKTHIYHCMNPDENMPPYWMKRPEKSPEEKQANLVEEFKNNPDAFFPDFLKKPN